MTKIQALSWVLNCKKQDFHYLATVSLFVVSPLPPKLGKMRANIILIETLLWRIPGLENIRIRFWASQCWWDQLSLRADNDANPSGISDGALVQGSLSVPVLASRCGLSSGVRDAIERDVLLPLLWDVSMEAINNYTEKGLCKPLLQNPNDHLHVGCQQGCQSLAVCEGPVLSK